MPKAQPTISATAENNAQLIRRYQLDNKGEDPKEPAALRQLAAQEQERYQAYWKALKQGKIPHAKAILNTFKLLEECTDPGVQSIARRLKQRRIIILYEDRLSGVGQDASGHLFYPGNRRPVFQTPGKKKIYAQMNCVIKVHSQYSVSYISTAAVLAHELWHVIAAERRGNDCPDIEPLQVAANDKNLTMKSVEDWADYLAGRTIAALGYTQDVLENKRRGKQQGWGPDFSQFKDHEMQKLNHFLSAEKAFEQRGAIPCGSPCRTKDGPCNNPVYLPPCHYH